MSDSQGLDEYPLGLESTAVHAGRGDLNDLGVHALPIDLSTTNPLPGIDVGGDSYEAMALGGHPTPGGMVYARLWNPTVGRFEEALAELEHAEASVAFASGMAALTALLLARQQECGGALHVVAIRPLYGGTDHLLSSGLFGHTVTYCAPHEVAEVMRDDTGLVVLETPANPTLDEVDIAAVVRAAGSIPVVVDNTVATPILQNPIDHGAAYVLHSATKSIGGHGDAVGGVIVCAEERARGIRRVRAITGGILHPLAAYLLHRGLPTLPVRVRAQQETAVLLAEFLRGQPEVLAVHHPAMSLQGVGGKQLRGPGSLLSFELGGGFAAAEQVVSRLRLATHAVSLGGIDTLVQHPASLTHRPVPPEARPHAGLIRVSVGLETGRDLLADFSAALAHLRSANLALSTVGGATS